MNLKGTATIQYAVAAAVFCLAAFLCYKCYMAYRFYSLTTETVVLYDSAEYGPALENASALTGYYRPGDPRLAAFEAHLLSLQDYHQKAIATLDRADRDPEGIVVAALAAERLFAADAPDSDLETETALLEKASKEYRYPDAQVSLGAAYLRAGDIAQARKVLEEAAADAGRLSLDGLVALRLNLGVLLTQRGEYQSAADSFRKVLELLPERKAPPLLGEREQVRISAQRGLVAACSMWLTQGEEPDRQAGPAIEYVTGLLGQVQVYSSGPKTRWDVGEFECVLRNALGVAQGRLGKYDEADKCFADALRETRRIPAETRAGFRQGISLNRAFLAAERARAAEGLSDSSRRSALREAAKDLAEAAAADAVPALWRALAYSLSASCYLDAGKEKEAQGAFEDALKLDPENAAVAANLAVVCDVQGRKTEALKYYEEALKLGELRRRIEIQRRVEKLKE
jgi:tetratricopeptide (TPR) repeat protein